MTRLSILALLLITAPVFSQDVGAATIDRAAIIAGVDQIAEASLARHGTVGLSIGVALDGETILTKGYGLADLENGVPATEGTVYRIGSVTKQFTAVATMMLIDGGQLTLETPLTTFLPDYPMQGHTVTIEHLLTHTSGIASYTSQPEFDELNRLELSHERLLGIFTNKPFEFPPGTGWSYSNSGYYLLGMIIERVSGRSYGDFVREEITAPIGMKATRYGDIDAIIPDRARGYKRGESGEFLNADPIGMSSPGAAGALVSTVIDLLTWQRALDEHQIVTSEAYTSMTTPAKLEDGSPTSYGFGLSIRTLEGHRAVEHGGGINGFASQLSRYPDDELTIVVLTNTLSPEATTVEEAIAQLIWEL